MARPAALLALALLAFPAHAQYRLDHWTADNGLPQNSVREILQTRDGYLWITTFDGLVRFDGVRFTVFNRGNSPELPSSRFVSLFEDGDGGLWAALETGEVGLRQRGRFTVYRPPQGRINPFLFDDGHSRPAVHYWRAPASVPGLVARSSLEAYRLLDGRFRRDPDLDVTIPALALPFDSSPDIQHGSKVIDGEQWTVFASRVERRSRKGAIRVYSKDTGLPGDRPTLVCGKGGPVQLTSVDAAGRLWLTELATMKSELLSRQPPDGMLAVGSLVDGEGNIWVNTVGDGLYRARRNAVAAFGRATGLPFGEMYTVLERKDGSLWIGTSGNGLYRMKDGVFTLQAGAGDEAFVVAGGRANNLHEDRAGDLWVNGYWRVSDGRLVRDPATVGYHPGGGFAMAEDGAGARFTGTADGVLRTQDGVTTHLTTRDGLAANETKVIIEDGRGGLWIGATGGITHYREGRLTAWTVKDGVPGDTVRALHLDGDGALWIGTYDSGLGRFKDGRFTRYTTHDGLFDNGVFQILDDGLGWFWMSCNRGIHRVRKKELDDFAAGRIRSVTSYAYNKSDGMPSAECNGGRWPAGVKTRDGKLWFPTMGGLAMVDPRTVRTNREPPPVVIEAMRVDRQSVDAEAWENAVHGGSGAAPIRVDPGQDNLEIEYTALSFINSENQRFRYKLEGADRDWVDAGTRRTAYYSRVPPGSYRFRVIAANADGVWNSTGASLPITVIPHFTRTWWFQALAVLSFAGVIAGAWAYRVSQLRRVQAAQQEFARELIRSQEHERKRIAAELHDSLGQNLLIVKNRAQIGQIAVQDDPALVEQFQSIASSVADSLDEVRNISQNLRPYHLDRLGLTKALEVMIENVAKTTSTRLRAELVPLDDLFSKEDAITLYRVVQEGLNNVVKHSGASEAVVSVERATDSVTVTIRDDGRGLPPDAASRHHGFGLAGMAERARMLGAVLSVDSAEGRGTRVAVRIRLPIARQESA